MNPSHEELRSLMALTCTPRVSAIVARRLVNELGSATEVLRRRHELPSLIPEVRPALVAALDCPAALRRADKELEFAEKNRIRCLAISDEGYPSRLRACDDAPLVLYTLGDANLNALRVVSVVGTRNITDYGRDLCTTFCHDLQRLVPDALVISGLAYGVDVAIHRGCLAEGLTTVGCLAHGLDRIYPSAHRQTASEMVRQGALVTEYMSFTEPERQNFLQRNRIIAGMADATILVESAVHGGGLVTCSHALDYGRSCFAFPGRVGDVHSQGCNNLIRNASAGLITSAEDFVDAVGWQHTNSSSSGPIQGQLFLDLSDAEERLIDLIRRSPDATIGLNQLAMEADVPINKLNSQLMMLEMKGAVRILNGSRVHSLC